MQEVYRGVNLDATETPSRAHRHGTGDRAEVFSARERSQSPQAKLTPDSFKPARPLQHQTIPTPASGLAPADGGDIEQKILRPMKHFQLFYVLRYEGNDKLNVAEKHHDDPSCQKPAPRRRPAKSFAGADCGTALLASGGRSFAAGSAPP